LLEALRILGSHANNYVVNDIINRRGDYRIGDETIFYSLFRENSKSISVNDITITPFNDVAFGKSYKGTGYNKSNLISERTPSNVHMNGVIFIPFNYENENDGKFWDNISLTPKEQDVIYILRVVDNRIKIVRFDSGNVKVLLDGEDAPRLLKNLGEGVNRLFTIALALVNAQNKILLIDEFEVGLHHSVQEQLWDVIFKYAKEWNIQVFATTHSRDTVKSFTTVAQKEENKGMANYFRLQKLRNSDDIVAVQYNEENLKTAIEQHIETR
jgi:AAA domain, putative AbiEii toxin, Type IV TA system